MVIVDNSILAFAFNLDNGIPIQSFFGTKKENDDQELLFLDSFLEEIFGEQDVRTYLNNTFKLNFLQAMVDGLDE